MRDMELRTHPKMKWEGWSNWPPACPSTYGLVDIFQTGEEGVLTNVEIAEADNILPPHLDLTIEHRGSRASGVICFDDERVIPRLFAILKGCIGWEIGRIGDLDVDL
jgi:hypothetical protein